MSVKEIEFSNSIGEESLHLYTSFFENEFSVEATVGNLCGGCVLEFKAKEIKNPPFKDYTKKSAELLEIAFKEYCDEIGLDAYNKIKKKKNKVEVCASLIENEELMAEKAVNFIHLKYGDHMRLKHAS